MATPVETPFKLRQMRTEPFAVLCLWRHTAEACPANQESTKSELEWYHIAKKVATEMDAPKHVFDYLDAAMRYLEESETYTDMHSDPVLGQKALSYLRTVFALLAYPPLAAFAEPGEDYPRLDASAYEYQTAEEEYQAAAKKQTYTCPLCYRETEAMSPPAVTTCKCGAELELETDEDDLTRDVLSIAVLPEWMTREYFSSQEE